MTDDLFDQPQGAGHDPLKQAVKTSAADVERLQQELGLARKLQQLLSDLAGYRDRDWPLHILDCCDRSKSFLVDLRQSGHPAVLLVEHLYRSAKEQAAAVIEGLPGTMEHMAKQENVPIDHTSRHPRYTFHGGFIEAVVDERRKSVQIKTREGKLADIPADPGAIIATVKSEEQRLFGRPFEGLQFLADLRSAYLAVLKSRKGRDGDPVPIRAACAALITKRRNYRKDEFLVDLSRLVREGPVEVKGCRFDLQQTKDTDEGMLLLGAAGSGMINLLIFKKPTTTTS